MGPFQATRLKRIANQATAMSATSDVPAECSLMPRKDSGGLVNDNREGSQ